MQSRQGTLVVRVVPMKRVHALVIALLLAATVTGGSYAVISTAKFGQSTPKPEVARGAALAKRAKQLDAWEASLDRALKTRTPALPPVPRYATIVVMRPASAGGLPQLVVVRRPARAAAKPAVKPTHTAGTRHAKRNETVALIAATPTVGGRGRDRGGDVPASVAPAPKPVDPPAASQSDEPPAAPAASASSPPPPTTSTQMSVEQQCEALKRAAENKGEAAKRQAEQQCEALKQQAEGQGSHD